MVSLVKHPISFKFFAVHAKPITQFYKQLLVNHHFVAESVYDSAVAVAASVVCMA